MPIEETCLSFILWSYFSFLNTRVHNPVLESRELREMSLKTSRLIAAALQFTSVEVKALQNFNILLFHTSILKAKFVLISDFHRPNAVPLKILNFKFLARSLFDVFNPVSFQNDVGICVF